MYNCHWDAIDGFRSIIEYNKFLKWMEAQIESGMSKEIERPNTDGLLGERWFECQDCRTKWRLMEPDPGYFAGCFVRVMNHDKISADNKIKSCKDFCEALAKLRDDKTFPEENPQTLMYVEAFQALLERWEGEKPTFGSPNDDKVSWAQLFEYIRAAGYYE